MGEGEEAPPAPAGPKGVDAFFGEISKYVGQSHGSFLGFVFIVLAIGVFLGYFVTARAPEYKYYAILGPVVLGLVAYYNRALAVLLLFLGIALLLLAA